MVKKILAAVGKGEELIQYVTDRPGHDRRYAIDNTKVKNELGWTPAHSFEAALAETVEWYRANQEWCDRVRSGAYLDYYDRQYGERIK